MAAGKHEGPGRRARHIDKYRSRFAAPGSNQKKAVKNDQYEYKMLPLLVRLKPDDFLARRRAMVEPAAPEQQESLLEENWFRWFAGGLIVGGVLVGLIVKLLM